MAMIDAHHHLWDLDAVAYPWLMAKGEQRFFGDPSAIQRNYLLPEFRRDAAGFQGSVHIQVGAADALAEARWVQSVADSNPDWPLVQVAFCDLSAEDFAEQLDRLQTLGTLRGVRQILGRAPSEDALSGTRELLQSPRFSAGLRELGQRALRFDLQLLPELMAPCARLLEQAPDTPIALCHAGSPHDRSTAGLAAWSAALKALSALPQVVCKLSGLGMFEHDWNVERIRPIVEICLEQFGPERCLYGSNFPVDSLYSDYARIVSAYRQIVPASMHGEVFGLSAVRFYDIDVS